MVRAKYDTSVRHHAKSPTDFATDADLESERAILDLIREARPADAFVGEEYGAQGEVDAPRRWLVDPLCGTLNFAAQTPLFSVNVALQTDSETLVAAVADPLSRRHSGPTEKRSAYAAMVPTPPCSPLRTHAWWMSMWTNLQTPTVSARSS